jgi:hypothetical protein
MITHVSISKPPTMLLVVGGQSNKTALDRFFIIILEDKY